MIDHVGIYGSRVAEGLSAFSVGLVNKAIGKKIYLCHDMCAVVACAKVCCGIIVGDQILAKQKFCQM